MILKQSILSARIVSLQASLHAQKDYLFCLRKRLQLMKTDLVEKSQYEINEISILRYTTLILIDKTIRAIKERQNFFNNQLFHYLAVVTDVENKFDSFLEDGKKYQNNFDELKHFLHDANWKTINENIDEKIDFFNKLEQLLDQDHEN